MNIVDNHFAIQYQIVNKIKKMVIHEIEHLGIDRDDEESLITCMNFVLNKILNEEEEPSKTIRDMKNYQDEQLNPQPHE